MTIIHVLTKCIFKKMTSFLFIPHFDKLSGISKYYVIFSAKRRYYICIVQSSTYGYIRFRKGKKNDYDND